MSARRSGIRAMIEPQAVVDSPRGKRPSQTMRSGGDTTLFFADQLKQHGPAYASAVAMEEVTLLDYNRTRPRGAQRLVAEYPSDGTFYSDDPYLTLNAPWVTPGQKRASTVFGKWLVAHIT